MASPWEFLTKPRHLSLNKKTNKQTNLKRKNIGNPI